MKGIPATLGDFPSEQAEPGLYFNTLPSHHVRVIHVIWNAFHTKLTHNHCSDLSDGHKIVWTLSHRAAILDEQSLML